MNRYTEDGTIDIVLVRQLVAVGNENEAYEVVVGTESAIDKVDLVRIWNGACVNIMLGPKKIQYILILMYNKIGIVYNYIRLLTPYSYRFIVL
jgi:hypothetical protein